ncbi:MAG: serine hydrolase domain-containing protein, partial [Candidatus Dormibacteria bacterium]
MNEPHAGRLVQAALGERYTAAVLRVVRGGRVCFERAYGTLDDAPAAAATEVTTRFDLASLTKPFVAHAALEAVAEGALALDRPLALELLPEWRGGAQAAVTARMLLAHNAGLASGADYRELLGRDIVRFALAQPLVAAPGEHALYSDLGFIVLGVALERALGRTLAALVAASCARLGCEATG